MPDDDQLPPRAVEIINRLRGARARDRQRIARTLHDQVAHMLGVALHSLELHQLYLSSDQPRAEAQLRNALRALLVSQETVRALCQDLRRRELTGTLDAALRAYLRAVAPSGITWAVRVTGDEPRLGAETAEELFLALREAARNALVHASAQHVEVIVRIEPDSVRATVSDDGTGFAVDQQPGTGGLASMRERVQLLGGRFALTSAPGAGTTVQIHVPLPAALGA
jgi:signal transduction histidine kinase